MSTLAGQAQGKVQMSTSHIFNQTGSALLAAELNIVYFLIPSLIQSNEMLK